MTEERLQQDRAASAAANQWQTGLLEAFCAIGKPLKVVAGVPQAAWPHGRLLARTHRTSLCDGAVPAAAVGYLNLPVVKWYRQAAAIRREIDGNSGVDGSPAVAFSYNAGYPEAGSGRWIRERFGCPWISVIADAPESTDPRLSLVRRTALRAYGYYQRRWIAEASGRIYLSWTLFEQEGRGPKLHLDGGIEAVRVRPPHRPSGPRVLMFSGTLSAYTGIDLLLEAFDRVEARDCELWISGRGNLDGVVAAAAARDPRIRFFGLVSRERMLDLMSRADVFLNPRPSSVPENRSNFPSKLLEYLSWCRPVLSTLTPGIAPHYREVLTPVETESPEGFAEAISDALELTDGQLSAAADRIRTFVESRLLWTAQAARVWDWLQRECGVRDEF